MCSSDLNGWLYVKHWVDPHVDENGKILVHLARGRGDLCVVHRGKLLTTRLMKGEVWEFNDRDVHFWLSLQPCTLLVANVGR